MSGSDSEPDMVNEATSGEKPKENMLDLRH